MSYSRLERVQELLREEISDIIAKGLHDPRIGFVTITATKVSPDLRHCKVFFTAFGDAQAKRQALQGLQNAAGFIRAEINRRVRLKFIPKLQFVLDEHTEKVSRVLQILDELEQKEMK